MARDSRRFAHRFDQISGSAIREIFKMIAKPGMISFAGGNPAASALPTFCGRDTWRSTPVPGAGSWLRTLRIRSAMRWNPKHE